MTEVLPHAWDTRGGFLAYLHPRHQHCTDEAQKAEKVYSYFEKGCREKVKKCTREFRAVIWDMINEY